MRRFLLFPSKRLREGWESAFQLALTGIVLVVDLVRFKLPSRLPLCSLACVLILGEVWLPHKLVDMLLV